MVLLSLKNLEIAFGGVRALKSVSMDVHEGLIFSIIGPNGAPGGNSESSGSGGAA